MVLGTRSAGVSDFVDGKEAQTKIEGEKTWDTVTADEIRQSAFAFPSSLTTSWSRRSAMTDTSVLKVPERLGKQQRLSELGPPEADPLLCTGPSLDVRYSSPGKG